MTGGFSFGNTNLIFGHAKRVIAKLNEGRQLKTEDEYREMIFKVFPP